MESLIETYNCTVTLESRYVRLSIGSFDPNREYLAVAEMQVYGWN